MTRRKKGTRSSNNDERNVETYYCPHFMHPFPCPYDSANRQKAEEYPVHQQTAPTTPPPNYTPNLTELAQPSLTAVDPAALAPCIYRFVYLWLKNGLSFWTYIVMIGRNYVSGWRYVGGRWVYFVTDLSEIKNFLCY